MVDDLYLPKVAGRSIQPLLVDDTDNSISYSGEWSAVGAGDLVGGTKDTPSIAQENTVHQTRSPTAVATFRFKGTSVSVHGLVVTGCQPPMTFTVDGKDTETAAQSLSGCVGGDLTSKQWFSADLASDDHVLTMQMRGTASQVNEYFILDYIQYMPLDFINTSTTTRSLASISTSTPGPTTTTTSSTTGQPSTQTVSTQTVSSQASHTSTILPHQNSSITESEGSKSPSSALSTITTTTKFQTSITVSFGSNTASTGSSSNAIVPSSSESAHQQQSPSANNNHSVLVGAIIGAVVGALVLVFIVMFFWRKRRSGTSRYQMTERVLVHDDTPDLPREEVEPFPSALQPRMAQEKSNFSSSQELTSDDFEANSVGHSSATHTRLQELVTRLEREVAGMQVRYAQLEGNSTDQVVTSTDDGRQVQPILPPPYYDDTRSNE